TGSHICNLRLLKKYPCGWRHNVFDVALSRSKHRTVGGGLPAMNDYAIFLTHRVTASPASRLPQKTFPFSRLRVV
ncbi:hypothetical protein, partial [Pseudomonas viridiflava]|uniref:hypothetical protein n=1 Tax=Pseudomonas viridiflava TaxID=33069 RepID=UPI001980A67D